MEIPWDHLGLARFCAVSGSDRAMFEGGRHSSDLSEDAESVPVVVFGALGESANDACYDVRLLARLLHPTLSDHELPTLCALHDVKSCSGEPARAVGELLSALASETLRLDREVVALLARLASEPLSDLFSRALVLAPEPHAGKKPPIEELPEKNDREVTVEGSAFEAGGFVAQALSGYERRDGQAKMAREVARLFLEGGALIVEAGPGTGKTFAYLIPAIEHLVRDRSARIVVSTRTKQLQEQLYGKDLPFLLSTMRPDLKVALLKGRENYLCLRRWEIAVRELSEGLERDQLGLLGPLVRWLWETETGDIDENAAFLGDPGGRELWGRLCDTSHQCIDTVCPHMDDCFSIRARRRARKADLLVVNHSLLLNDLAVDRVVLGKYTHVVLDEAHAFEETARSAFTWTLSARVVERLADELTPSRRRRVGWLDRLSVPRGDADVRAAFDLVASLRMGTARFLSALGRSLPSERRGPLPSLGDFDAILHRIGAEIDRLEEAVEALIERIDEPELGREGEGYLEALRGLGGLVQVLGAPREADAVHWYERERAGLSLHVTPLEVAPILARIFYPALDGVVLTSATLSVDRDFTFVLRALGLDAAFPGIVAEIVPSAFSYKEHMRICVPRALPSVTGDHGAYETALAEFLSSLARRIDKKGLVLFTSYRMLEEVRRRLPEDLRTLAQGVDGPRSKLLERFKRSARGMLLLGTDSFWEGVDLPGDDLEYVVITRLPFAVPTDPIQAALGERYTATGRDPFRDLALPRAVLKMRQGVGRLIRTQRDRGAVILADRRVLTRSYGQSFVDALPAPLEVFDRPEDLVANLGRWFDEADRSRTPIDLTRRDQ